MPYGNEMKNPMNSNRSMSDILMDMDKIICWHKYFNDKSMRVCHAAGFNGMKRMHRVLTRCFLDYHLCLENEAFDKFRISLDTEYEHVNYSTSDLIEHLKNWNMKLGQDMEKLAMLNNEYRMHAGLGNKTAKQVLKKMAKNYEKSGRWYRRFEETKSMHDLYDFDSQLHEKMKKKEEGSY